jgi:hypothetical protein
MSHHHIGKDPEALEFVQKCFALLEKLQAVPGVPTIPSYAAHEAFIAEAIVSRDQHEEKLRQKAEEKLHNKAKPTKRPVVSLLWTSLQTMLFLSLRSPMLSSSPTTTWRSLSMLLSVPKYVL